jgi:hypothetical protein
MALDIRTEKQRMEKEVINSPIRTNWLKGIKVPKKEKATTDKQN